MSEIVAPLLPWVITVLLVMLFLIVHSLLRWATDQLEKWL